MLKTTREVGKTVSLTSVFGREVMWLLDHVFRSDRNLDLPEGWEDDDEEEEEEVE